SFLQSVEQEIGRVEFDIAVKLPAHGSNVADVYGQVRTYVSGDCQRHVLNVSGHRVRVDSRQARVPGRNGGQRHGLEGNGHRNDAGYFSEVEVLQVAGTSGDERLIRGSGCVD